MSRATSITIGLLAVLVVGLYSAYQEPVEEPVQQVQAEGLLEPSDGPYYPEAEATKEPGPSPKSVYCVREGGFPNGDYSENDYPECIWVDKLEEVPPGKPCYPSGCNSSDHEYTRRYWCVEGTAEDPPMEEIPQHCRQYYR